MTTTAVSESHLPHLLMQVEEVPTMNHDPDAEVARLVTLVGEEAGLIRDLAIIAERLLAVMDAKRQLRTLATGQRRAALLRRARAGRP